MSQIVSDDQIETFIVLLRSEIDRLDEIIEYESEELDVLSSEELQDMIKERDKLVKMCNDVGGESL